MYIFNNLFQLILVVPFTTAGILVHDPFYCYTRDPFHLQQQRFSHLTSYETARGRVINPAVSSCTPNKFWFISRYGTRFATDTEIIDMTNNHKRLRVGILNNWVDGKTSLCRDDGMGLHNWSFDSNLTVNVQRQLTRAGWNEMEGIGRRYAQAFPTLLPPNYSPERHLFRSTNQSLTRNSLEAFADGVFGRDAHLQVQFEETPGPNEDDVFLRPHLACPLYSEVAANGSEHNEFIKGPEYLQTLTEISQKLGFHGFRQLSREDIHIIGNLCRYEQIWNMSSLSPWCASSSLANHVVLEYFRDLDFHWRMGYGPREFRTLYENLNCHLMQDFLRFIVSNDPNDHLSRVYSTNTPIVPLILVTLGAFEDEAIFTRFNMGELTSRLWRSSQIIPMGTNLAIVKYSCVDGDDDLLFLFNERPLQLEGCQANGLCKQALIVERFNRFLNANCNEVFCSNSR